ncbi:MAG: 3-oxoacid CoA-transferase subunit A [Leptolyngbya sp. PLA2]|nr:3-oxoacid CoA-transferase subunit A [Leptolyngbya sp.]MCE7971032.1 3-oxoacid CoA-transferase subunit A [Leptolyngbya sp. PL-A2]MCZ7631896.1 3-oxoacid CoA-transferase subunit A [Phycisphaerales bacterium]MDL1905342.1 3-oxoacid CoA-transferase subunit A [Synechococcales cyanobacterium CNB]GIK20298.1 MAG: 3-oxoadipate CoA-transferase subunit A [Planctomycetota bacterium]
MIDKRCSSVPEAVACVPDGAAVMIGGFGSAGSPVELIHALIDHGVRGLTVISNNAGCGRVGLAALIEAGRVERVVCSFPRSADSEVFASMYRAGRVALDLVPQGTLAERIRAGGAGIPAFYTPVSVGTPLGEGKERRTFAGGECVLEHALTADFALVKAERADRYGNLVYRKTARNFGPIMCMASRVAIAQARRVVEPGEIDPEVVVTPGVFVQRVVEVREPADESVLVREGRRYP